MGTRNTLAEHESPDGKASWRLLEELFETQDVYLEMRNVTIEMMVADNGQNNVVVRLPLKAAKRLVESKIDWEKISGKFDE